MENISYQFPSSSKEIIKSNEDQIIVVQIAGLIARRIFCEVSNNDEVQQGDRIGIIRFGSRVDLYFDNFFGDVMSIFGIVTLGLLGCCVLAVVYYFFNKSDLT